MWGPNLPVRLGWKDTIDRRHCFIRTRLSVQVWPDRKSAHARVVFWNVRTVHFSPKQYWKNLVNCYRTFNYYNLFDSLRTSNKTDVQHSSYLSDCNEYKLETGWKSKKKKNSSITSIDVSRLRHRYIMRRSLCVKDVFVFTFYFHYNYKYMYIRTYWLSSTFIDFLYSAIERRITSI